MPAPADVGLNLDNKGLPIMLSCTQLNCKCISPFRLWSGLWCHALIHNKRDTFPQSAQHHNPDDHNLNYHHHEDFRSPVVHYVIFGYPTYTQFGSCTNSLYFHFWHLHHIHTNLHGNELQMLSRQYQKFMNKSCSVLCFSCLL